MTTNRKLWPPAYASLTVLGRRSREQSRAVKGSQGQYQGQAMIRHADWLTPLFPQLCSISVVDEPVSGGSNPCGALHFCPPYRTLRPPCAYPTPALCLAWPIMAALVSAANQIGIARCAEHAPSRPLPRPRPTLDIWSPEEPLGRGRAMTIQSL